MDIQNVALVSFLLLHNKFDEFICERPQIFGVNISHIAKILQFADNEDKITLKVDPNYPKLNFTFEGQQDDLVSHFSLNIISIDSDQLGIPVIDYPAVVNMRSDEFARVCRVLSDISDTLSISVSKSKVTFFVNGKVGDGEITLKPREKGERLIAVEIIENVICSYDLRYLNLFNKACTLGEEVQLHISKILPIILTYGFELGFIKYYLAPKVNGE